MPPTFATYLGYSDINGGKPSTIDEFRSYLARYQRDRVVFICSVMNCLLRMWAQPMPLLDAYEAFVRDLFAKEAADKIISASRSGEPHRYLFHRQQLLFVAKEAILSCKSEGIDPLGKPLFAELGLAFLMANDLLHFDFPEPNTTSQRIIQTLAEFIPALEYSGRSDFRYKAMRTYKMLGEVSDELSHRNDFLDIRGLFEAAQKQPLFEYQALCFAILSKYLGMSLDSAKTEKFAVTRSWFASTTVPSERIQHFLQDLSLTGDDFAQSLERRNLGRVDFTAFRDKPLFRDGDRFYALDPGFLAEKLESGVFWKVHVNLNSDRDKKKLHSHWGNVFHTYASRLLSEFADGKRNIFYPSPKYRLSKVEASDGLVICGSTAILMEFKGCTFTAGAKYGGDVDVLKKEIEEKLVGTEAERKGVRQLTDTILRLFARGGGTELEGMDITRITRVFPVLVTRDDIGGAVLINRYLNQRFRELLNPKTVRVTLTPLFCLSSEALEHVAPFLGEATLADILEARYQEEPALQSSFMLVRNRVTESIGVKENTYLYRAFDEFVNSHVGALFPRGVGDN